MKRLRLAWIVPGFQANAQDRCIPALTDLAHGVAERHDLSVFALQYPGREDFYQVGSVKIHSFRAGPPANIPKLRQIGPFWRARQSLLAEDKQQPFDLIHSFWAAEPGLLAGWTRPGLTKKPPLVVSIMGGEPVALPNIGYGAALHRLDRFYLTQSLRRADIVTVGSETLAGIISSKFTHRATLRAEVQPLGHPSGRSSKSGKRALDIGHWILDTLPLGVNLERFAPGNYSSADSPPETKITILAVGSLLPVKGQANLIRAFKQVLQQQPEIDLNLRIIGQGICNAELARLIAELNLGERVKLIGAVAPAQMPQEYRQAQIFALSSYYESQCVALCEAMASGLPVVSAPVGLAPELLREGRAGELADSNQPEVLAAALTRLLARRVEWPEMGRAARHIAEARLSLKVCTARFLDMYEAAIQLYPS